MREKRAPGHLSTACKLYKNTQPHPQTLTYRELKMPPGPTPGDSNPQPRVRTRAWESQSPFEPQGRSTMVLPWPEDVGPGIPDTLVQVPALPLSSCVTSGKLLPLPEPVSAPGKWGYQVFQGSFPRHIRKRKCPVHIHIQKAPDDKPRAEGGDRLWCVTVSLCPDMLTVIKVRKKSHLLPSP